MFLVVEKGIKGGICHVIHQYAKSNNKYMKDYGCKKSIQMVLNILKCYLTFTIIHPLCMKRMKIEKVEKWYHLYDKTEYVIHIRNLK